VRKWRNDPLALPSLRTKEPLTEAQQESFFVNVVSVSGRHKYYSLYLSDEFVGFGGLTFLGRVPGEGEISLIVNPSFRSHGLGLAAVTALLVRAFDVIRLSTVIGECYNVEGGSILFWQKVIHSLQDLYSCSGVWTRDAFCWAWRKEEA